MRVVGGPFDGRDIELQPGVTALCPCLGTCPEDEPFLYHKTRPTDTNWRDELHEPIWYFMRGLPEPAPPDYVLEWHERGWESPEVAMIRGAVQEAAERFR